MAKNVVGTPARGKDFYGRGAVIDLIWEKLESNHLLLAAPRRFGKTSVMLNLLDNPRDTFKVIHFDLEPVTEPVDFVVTLLDKLRYDETIRNVLKKSSKGFRKFLEEINFGVNVNGVDFRIGLKSKIEKSWKEIGKEIFSVIENTDKKIILIFDEFALMIENFLDDRLNENEVKEFLRWFRSLRIDPLTTKCRFVVGSSISIDHRLSDLGVLDSFNDFERIKICEFEDVETAKSFLDFLLAGKKVNISSQAKIELLKLVGPPIPYFIQVFVSQIINNYSGRNDKASKKNISDIYEHEILGVTCKSYFQIYYDRLKHYNKINEKTAKMILKNLALSEEIRKTELYQIYLKETQKTSDIEGFNDLMSDLENDFYIKFVPGNESYIFFSKILKDWWRRYYSL